MIKSTLERINPGDDYETEAGDSIQLHIERYRFAGKHLQPGVIADIACGLGYGSFLLANEFSNKIARIFAVDNNESAIEFARRKYFHPDISFINADAITFEPEIKLDSVVSLETIEHLEEPGIFIENISRHLVSGGRFIASVPVTPSMDANPYHLHDFMPNRFRKMFFANGMKEIASMIQVQHYKPLSLLLNKDKGRMQDKRKNIPLFYLKHPVKFFLRLRSFFRDGFTNKYLVVVFEKG